MRFLFTFCLMTALLGLSLFIAAGRIDLPFFWVWYGILLGAATITAIVMDPGLRQERLKPGAGGLDRTLRRNIGPFFPVHLIVAGLDVGRFHFSDSVPLWLQVAAMALFAGAMALSVWSVLTNRFFSPVVRIQEERGHTVISGGPYRFIRHPGYAAACLMMLASGCALGSWTAAAIMLPPVGLILRRAVIEDRFLRDHLTGYAEYAARVRWRLIPAIW